MPNANTSTPDDLALISNVYSLLARMWLHEVDADLIMTLNDPPLRDALAAAGGVVPAIDDIDELAVEYCRLFIGPKEHLPPYQSVWVKGELQGEIASSVQLFADALNYEASTARPNTMRDHLGIELDLMARATAVQSHAPDSIAIQELRRELYARHLSWPTKMFAAVQSRTTSPFYTALVTMTRELLASEA